MPTPMHVYNEIAARYGVDPSDEDAVCRWFEEEAAKLPEEEQVAIALELLERDGESVMSDQWIDFNLNSDVRVKLTDVGRMRYREFHARFGMDRSPQEDADGWYRCQMHELMQIWGDMMWNGNNALPFSTNVQLWFGDLP